MVDALPRASSDFSGLAGVTLERTNPGVSARAETGGLELLKRRVSRGAASTDQKLSALHAHADRASERGLASWPQGTDWFAMEESLTLGAIDEAFALEDALEREVWMARRR